MREETIYEGLKQELRGMKDPGSVLIFIYILLIVALLLFAGLQSAKADFHSSQATVTTVDTRPGGLAQDVLAISRSNQTRIAIQKTSIQ